MTYEDTRGRLEQYFDRTAADTWARLTSDAPVSRVRETVRAGRDRMRAVLIEALPADLTGKRVLDAGCGVGQLAVELARRGAEVVGVDISPNLLEVARKRLPEDVADRIRFVAGDMLDPGHGMFDHVVAMDSLIHYRPGDIASALARLAGQTRESMVFTIAPATPFLTAFWVAGQMFPRSDRSPAIRPLRARTLSRHMARDLRLRDWALGVRGRVSGGFYISEALEVRRS